MLYLYWWGGNWSIFFLQKNLNLEKQVGSQFVMTGYPLQHLDARSVRRAHEVGKFPASNQPNHSISVAFSNPVLQSQIAFSGPSVGSSAVKPQPLGGVPVAAPGSFPTICSFIGTTDQKCVTIYFFSFFSCTEIDMKTKSKLLFQKNI